MLGSEWIKSSYSFSNGNCIEAAWRKATASMANGNCPEVGNGAQVVAVRDTKQAHLGDERTVLEFTPAAWRRFLDGLR